MYQVNALGLPGLYFRDEEIRIYPHKFLASHVLGGVNSAGNGISGVELSFDEDLSKGKNVHLNIDIRIQEALRKSLMKGLTETQAKSVSAVSMDPRTGEVVAMASLPDFDANHYGQATAVQWKNRVLSSVYELGSTFKILTMAQALESQKINVDTPIDCTRALKVGKFRIRDHYPKNTYLSASEVLIYSSNIGTARIADMFESGAQKEFFSKLGLLDPVDIGLKETVGTLYPEDRRWGRIATMSMSYGHGIAVSPLHMATAASTIVYDGKYRSPQLIKGEKQEAPKEVISLETAKKMRYMMQRVVSEGTGRRAKLIGYDIGGKTGTAEKSIAGGYSKDKNIASFVGVLPANAPQLVTVVVVDEGKDNHNTGASAAAPIFKDFVKAAAPILGIAPSAFLSENNADNLLKQRKYNNGITAASFRP